MLQGICIVKYGPYSDLRLIETIRVYMNCVEEFIISMAQMIYSETFISV